MSLPQSDSCKKQSSMTWKCRHCEESVRSFQFLNGQYSFFFFLFFFSDYIGVATTDAVPSEAVKTNPLIPLLRYNVGIFSCLS